MSLVTGVSPEEGVAILSASAFGQQRPSGRIHHTRSLQDPRTSPQSLADPLQRRRKKKYQEENAKNPIQHEEGSK